MHRSQAYWAGDLDDPGREPRQPHGVPGPAGADVAERQSRGDDAGPSVAHGRPVPRRGPGSRTGEASHAARGGDLLADMAGSQGGSSERERPDGDRRPDCRAAHPACRRRMAGNDGRRGSGEIWTQDGGVMSVSSQQPQQFEPDWSVHPGAVLRDLLETRRIRQSELAERTGLSAKHVNQIVNEVVGISGDVALLLELALDVPVTFWTRLEADHQAYLSKEKAKGQFDDLTAWAAGFDLPTLIRHGITDRADGPAERVEKILKFFGVANREAFDRTWLQPRVSFRRSQSFTVAEQNTALWLRLVDRCAERISVEPLSATALRKVARMVPAMTNLSVADGFTAAQAALAEAGVVLTFIREVPGTRLCGATWWLGADRPVIGLTERHRKPDTFWFNLIHEIGHILLHPKRTTFLNLDDEKATGVAAEQEANEFAESILLPESARAQIARARTRSDLLLLAAKLGIGVTIVAGQHGHLTDKWNVGGSLRGKITDTDIGKLEELCANLGA